MCKIGDLTSEVIRTGQKVSPRYAARKVVESNWRDPGAYLAWSEMPVYS